MLSGGGDIYTMRIQNPWFTYIKNGEKTIEGRPNVGKHATFKPKQHIKIMNKEESLMVEIVGILHYASFSDLFTYEGIENILPGKNEVDGIQVYRQWYSEEKEREFGVIGLRLRLM